MDRMYNPPHPGEMLSELSSGMTVAELAPHLKVSRDALIDLINGKAAISVAMAEKLAVAFPCTTPKMWLEWQIQYDLWQFEHNNPAELAEAIKGVTPSVPKVPIATRKIPVELTDDYPRKEFY